MFWSVKYSVKLKLASNCFRTTVNWDICERLKLKLSVVRTTIAHPKHFRVGWNFFFEGEDFTLYNLILNFRSEGLD